MPWATSPTSSPTSAVALVQCLLEMCAGQGHPPLRAAVQDAVSGHFFFLTWEGGMYEFTGEFMKASVDVVDLIRPTPCHVPECRQGGVQVMGAARGWATTCSLCPTTSPSEWEPRALSLTGSTSRRAWTPTLVWSITSTHPPGSR